MLAVREHADPTLAYHFTMREALRLVPAAVTIEVVHFGASSPHRLTRTQLPRVQLVELMFTHGVRAASRHACATGYRLVVPLGAGMGRLFVRT